MMPIDLSGLVRWAIFGMIMAGVALLGLAVLIVYLLLRAIF